jgi:hypothetical protein
VHKLVLPVLLTVEGLVNAATSCKHVPRRLQGVQVVIVGVPMDVPGISILQERECQALQVVTASSMEGMLAA